MQDDVQAYMWLNLGSSRMTREDREFAVKSRDVVAERVPPSRSPKPNASRLNGTPRPHATHPRPR